MISVILASAVGTIVGCVLMAVLLNPLRRKQDVQLERDRLAAEADRVAIAEAQARYAVDIESLEHSRLKLVEARETILDREAVASATSLELDQRKEDANRRSLEIEAYGSALREQLQQDHESKLSLLASRNGEIDRLRTELEREFDAARDRLIDQLAVRATELEERQIELSRHRSHLEDGVAKLRESLVLEHQGVLDQVSERERAVANVHVGIKELSRENGILKSDLRNLAVAVRKSRLDHEHLCSLQAIERERTDEIAKLYLGVTEKAVSKAISATNFTACKDRLLRVIEQVRDIGFKVSSEDERRLVDQLKHDFELEVRSAMDKAEQARIKAEMREAERAIREAERAKAEASREAKRAAAEAERAHQEQVALQILLDHRLQEMRGCHDAEVDRLKALISEVELAKNQAIAAAEQAIADGERAISNAQLTKRGNVYVISNMGSFGDGVFKVGMTRRSDPADRVKELGDASVPFPFDVHMMISCEDAPALENALHRGLAKARMNRVNPRKEYFRTDFQSILAIVKTHHSCEVVYQVDAAALEWRQSREMSEADAAFIEEVYEREGEVVGVEE